MASAKRHAIDPAYTYYVAYDNTLTRKECPAHTSIGSIKDDMGRPRVVQVAVGSEHGVLLTDFGVVYTWGDNRSGQLGRLPCLKEEDGQPFPVLALLSEEITQVAAGKYHCLALTSAGLVYAWGRNKHGQCGDGGFRDKTEPKKVMLDDGDKAGTAPIIYLGTGLDEQVIAIGAGELSSVASCRNGKVFQWGAICEEYQDNAGKKVNRSRPLELINQENYRSYGGRHDKKITDVGCLMLKRDLAKKTEGKQEINKSKVNDKIETVHNLYEHIAAARAQLQKFDKDQDEENEKRQRAEGDSDGKQQEDLSDTTAMLEREVEVLERELELYEKNLKSCEQQAHHNKLQIGDLENQGMRLSEMLDKVLYDMVQTGKKGGTEYRKLDEQQHDIKEFMEANQNTRMTLMEQQAEIEKEKQHLQAQAQKQKKTKEIIKKRLEFVLGFKDSGGFQMGASDASVSAASAQLGRIKEHYEEKRNRIAKEFLEAKSETEADAKFMEEVKQSLEEMREGSEDFSRGEKLCTMMGDVIGLHQTFSDMHQDRWSKNDLDVKSFFAGSRMPKKHDPKEEETLKSSRGGSS